MEIADPSKAESTARLESHLKTAALELIPLAIWGIAIETYYRMYPLCCMSTANACLELQTGT